MNLSITINVGRDHEQRAFAQEVADAVNAEHAISPFTTVEAVSVWVSTTYGGGRLKVESEDHRVTLSYKIRQNDPIDLITIHVR